MKINYLQIYDYDLNISKRLNECISLLPDEWICLTDQDTLKFSEFPNQLKQVLEVSSKDWLIGSMTNRLRKSNPQVVKDLFDESDINKHFEFSEQNWNRNRTELEQSDLIAGCCMIFHKELWSKIGGFREDKIFFDKYFSYDVYDKGGLCMIAKGLYVFHLYRWGSSDPVSSVSHLVR